MDKIKKLNEDIAEKRSELNKLNEELDKKETPATEEEQKRFSDLADEIESMERSLKFEESREAGKLKSTEPKQNDPNKDEQRKAALAAGGQVVDSAKNELLKVYRSIDYTDVLKRLSSKNPVLDGAAAEITQVAVRESVEGGNSEVSYDGLGIPGAVLRAEWESKIEKRTDIDQTTSGIQPTVVGRYVEAIRQDSVATKVIPSSNILSGLTSDFKIPTVGSQSVAWATAENSAAADGGANFGKDTLSPIRITGFVDVSDRVILQNGDIAMNLVMTDLGRATANLIDAALFSTTNVSNAIPAIAATSGVLTFTEAVTYAAPSSTVNGTVFDDFLASLQALANGNTAKGQLAYVGHTKLFSDLVKSPQVLAVSAASGMPMYGSPLLINMNGIPFYLTTSNTSNGTTSADFIGGDFNYQFIGLFGGLDISVDPYTNKKNAQKTIVVHRWLDAATMRGAGFVKSTTLLS